jgi:hypothetical protein
MKLNYKGNSKVIERLCEVVNGLTDTLASKQNNLTFDASPTKESANPVTSGGIFEEIEKIKEAQIRVVDGKLQVTINGKTYLIAQEDG